MSELRVFDFDERLGMSHCVGGTVREVLLQAVPEAVSAREAIEKDDKTGIDWWVLCINGREMTVDVKVRERDFLAERGLDDLALETISVGGAKIGWTLDDTKLGDYVMWWWEPTGRSCLMPLPMLRRAFGKRLREWQAVYRSAGQITVRRRSKWESECLFVPRRVVWAAIEEDASTLVAPPALQIPREFQRPVDRTPAYPRGSLWGDGTQRR